MKVTISSNPDKWPVFDWDKIEAISDEELVLMHRRAQNLLMCLSGEVRNRLSPPS
jgi:hypothetical protein